MKARTEFESTRNALMEYCEVACGYECEVKEETYPIRVVFKPIPQETLFDDQAVEKLGELMIEVGLDTKVTSTLKFKMDASLLKKFIKSSEKIAFLYYHAFREEAGDLDDGDWQYRLKKMLEKADLT